MHRNQQPGVGLFVDLGLIESSKESRDGARSFRCKDFFMRSPDGEIAGNMKWMWVSNEEWPKVADEFLACPMMSTPDGMVVMRATY